MKAFLNSLSMRIKLGLLTLISTLGMIAMTLFLAYGQYQQSLMDRKALVRSAVETASGTLAWAQEQAQKGTFSKEQAQELAFAAVTSMRFGENEYFWIIDKEGVILGHPINPHLHGKGPDTVRDPNGVYITKEAAQVARTNPGGKGFFSYQWVRPNEQEPVDKISFVQAFAPWEVVLVSGLYIDDLKSEFLANLLRIGIAVVLLLIVVAWLSYNISNSMLRGMGKAEEVLGKIAQGDLSSQINIKGKDEIGRLLLSVMHMQQQFGNVVASVRQGAEGVSSASSEIAQGNHDLSARTESQASALQQTAASMEQLNSTVRQNADNARQANQLAQSASHVASQGGEVVADVVRTMREINDSSSRIADIIGVIDSIAFQTNILALNAAVEAARAGEQGRGFAVVASEVRALAQRSGDAAHEIKNLIDASVQRVESGSALVDKAGQTMTEVVSAIQRVTDIVAEISAASVEQSAGVNEVGQAVSQMDQTTQQNAALVEQMSAAASSLSLQAQDLLKAVSVFKLQSQHQATGMGAAARALNGSAAFSAPAPQPSHASKPLAKAGTLHAPQASSAARAAPRPTPRTGAAPSTPKLAAPPKASPSHSPNNDEWESF